MGSERTLPPQTGDNTKIMLLYTVIKIQEKRHIHRVDGTTAFQACQYFMELRVGKVLSETESTRI